MELDYFRVIGQIAALIGALLVARLAWEFVVFRSGD
jgi:hypothetical protein